MGDALDQQDWLVDITGNHRGIARPGAASGWGSLTERALAGVQPQVSLARRLVGTVAGEAVVGENRPDVALEVDGGSGLGSRGGLG